MFPKPLWDIAPSTLVDINQCFIAYCFHHQPSAYLSPCESQILPG